MLVVQGGAGWCRVVPGGLGWFWVGGALALGQAHKKRGEPKAKQ